MAHDSSFLLTWMLESSEDSSSWILTLQVGKPDLRFLDWVLSFQFTHWGIWRISQLKEVLALYPPPSLSASKIIFLILFIWKTVNTERGKDRGTFHLPVHSSNVYNSQTRSQDPPPGLPQEWSSPTVPYHQYLMLILYVESQRSCWKLLKQGPAQGLSG